MLSELTQAEIVNGVVLATVLASDLGPARKIGPMRLLRPVIAAAVIIPLFVSRPVTHGTGLAVEIAGAVAGLLAGLAAAALMQVYCSPTVGRPVSRAGAPYAILWTVIVAARAAFSYSSVHWSSAPAGQLGHRQPRDGRGPHRRADLHGHHDGARAHRRAPGPGLPPASPGPGGAERLAPVCRGRPDPPRHPSLGERCLIYLTRGGVCGHVRSRTLWHTRIHAACVPSGRCVHHHALPWQPGRRRARSGRGH